MEEKETNFAVGRKIGHSDLRIESLGIGGAPLGDPSGGIPETQASATLEKAYDKGIRYFDTAPWYGRTKSEHRFGHVLRQKPRSSFKLNTKVGRIFHRPDDPSALNKKRWKGGLPFDLRFDYSRSGFQRSYEDSLQRLGLYRIDSLTVHDLDYKYHIDDEGVDRQLDLLHSQGGLDWLQERKAAGEIQAIGVGVNQEVMIPKFVERFTGWDFFIVAMPYTLLDQSALDEAFPLCKKHGISVIIGAVFASGILTGNIGPDSWYNYQPAQEAMIDKARRIEAVCLRHGVPLGAAALQFPLAHPVVASVIPGAIHPDQVETNLDWMAVTIPNALWEELKSESLIRDDAPAPTTNA